MSCTRKECLKHLGIPIMALKSLCGLQEFIAAYIGKKVVVSVQDVNRQHNRFVGNVIDAMNNTAYARLKARTACFPLSTGCTFLQLIPPREKRCVCLTEPAQKVSGMSPISSEAVMKHRVVPPCSALSPYFLCTPLLYHSNCQSAMLSLI